MGVGNETAGYQVSGQSPSGQYTTADKISYSTETLAAVPGAVTSVVRNGGTGVGNNDAGYFSGGGPGRASSTDKLTYSTETTALLPSGADSSQNRSDVAGGVSNSSSGYILGGRNPSGTISIADKINFSNDTLAYLPGANLPAANKFMAGASSRSNALPTTQASPIINLNGEVSGPNTGYFCCGFVPAAPGTRSSVDKTDFSTDTTARAPGAPRSFASYLHGGSSNNINGYLAGNFGGSGSSIINKLTYSTDSTVTAPGANLSVARGAFSGTGNADVGYYSGGYVSPNGYSTTDKITYSTDSVAAVPGAALSAARYYVAAYSSSQAGYFQGGVLNTSPQSRWSTIDKITYSNDTRTTPPATLSNSRYGLGAPVSSEIAGYNIGGYDGSNYRTEVDKLTYSNDTSSIVPSISSSNLLYSTGTGNSTHGYHGGGYTPSTISTVAKMNFATETKVNIPSGLSQNVYGATGLGARMNPLPDSCL